MNQQSSRVFSPFRVLGVVTGDLPCQTYYLGNKPFVTVCIGKAFHVYDCQNLKLKFVSEMHQDDIQAICTIKTSKGVYTVTSVNSLAYVWDNSRLVYTLLGHSSPITKLVSFSEDSLLSVSYKDGHAVYWEDSLEVASFEVGKGISCVIHPPTYVDKVLIGFHSGVMELWNIKTGTMLHRFSKIRSESVCISCLENSKVLDVVSIGYNDGTVIIFNIRTEVVVMELDQKLHGSVSNMSFGLHGLLVCGTSLGHIVTWNLNDRKIQSLLQFAHSDEVVSVDFIGKEPVFLSSGSDNSLKIWIFDQGDGQPRTLKQRFGHSDNPTKIRFTKDGKRIISASGDQTVMMFNIFRDEQSIELSQKSIRTSYRRFLPRVVDLDFSESRIMDWDSMLTCHEDHGTAYTWNLDRKVLGVNRLAPRKIEGIPDDPITCVKVSMCGNYGIIGTKHGGIYRYNMQSGLFNKAYWNPLVYGSKVIGIGIDMCNRYVYAVFNDGLVRWFEFHTGNFLDALDLEERLTVTGIHIEVSFLAVGTNSGKVLLLDTSLNSKRIVRCFAGHSSGISDICFSQDARWLISSCSDGSCRLFDIPSGALIDCFRFMNPLLSISLSPQGDFLATSFADNSGIYIWANRAYYSNVFPRVVDNVPIDMDVPGYSIVEKDGEPLEHMPGDEEYRNTIAPEEGFITLSNVSRAHWEAVIHIEEIKRRNHSSMAIKNEKEAPFFLPTSNGLDVGFNINEEDKAADLINDFSQLHMDLGLETYIREHISDDELFNGIDRLLLKMSPSGIDAEIKSLGFDVEALENLDVLSVMLDYIIDRVRKPRNFDYIQSILFVFLRSHQTELATNSSNHQKLRYLLQAQKDIWGSLEERFHSTLCMTQFLSRNQ